MENRLTNVECFETGGGCLLYSALFNNEVWIATDFETVGSYDIPFLDVTNDFDEHDVPFQRHYKKASVPYPTWSEIADSLYAGKHYRYTPDDIRNIIESNWDLTSRIEPEFTPLG